MLRSVVIVGLGVLDAARPILKAGCMRTSGARLEPRPKAGWPEGGSFGPEWPEQDDWSAYSPVS